MAPWGPERLRAVGDRLVYGGVGFEVARGEGVPPLQLPVGRGFPVEARWWDAVRRRVRLRLHTDASLPRHGGRRGLRATRSGAAVAVSTERGVARLVRRGYVEFDAEAWTAPATLGAAEMDLLQAIATVVLASSGGGVLHAAAVELDGGAFLFLGPPDAGKTTACRHTGGGRLFAVDRVALERVADRWRAWTVPGGAEDELEDMPGSAEAALPVRGLLRVVHGTERVQVEPLSAAKAAMVVRASLLWPFGTAHGASDAFEVAERVARDVPVGAIHTVLGRSNAEALRAMASAGAGPAATGAT